MVVSILCVLGWGGLRLVEKHVYVVNQVKIVLKREATLIK